ncbi:MAG: SCO family protein [bacterium]|nr:SCO family protein [bacterium]
MQVRCAKYLFLAALFTWLIPAQSSFAGEGSLQAPKDLEGTEIIDKRGSTVAFDVELVDHEGKKQTLATYFGPDQTKPVILTLGYYKCPMLCNLVLNGFLDSLKTMSLTMGKDFRVVSVSINPKETFDLGRSKRANYLKAINLEDDADWSFFVGEESEVKRLADSVGFQYRFHKPSGEYIHSAGIFVLSPQGILSRTLYGIDYKTPDVKMALIDASHGKIGSLLDRVILSCFHYDPDSHKYGVYIFGLMRVGGLFTILVIGLMLFLYWRYEKRSRVA